LIPISISSTTSYLSFSQLIAISISLQEGLCFSFFLIPLILISERNLGPYEKF
jgi:hypothetical protein